MEYLTLGLHGVRYLTLHGVRWIQLATLQHLYGAIWSSRTSRKQNAILFLDL